MFAFLTDGHVAGGLSVHTGDIIGMAFFFHLPVQTFGRVHPFHHVVNLFRTENFTVSVGKGLFGQLADDRNVFRSRFYNVYHNVSGFKAFCRFLPDKGLKVTKSKSYARIYGKQF